MDVGFVQKVNNKINYPTKRLSNYKSSVNTLVPIPRVLVNFSFSKYNPQIHKNSILKLGFFSREENTVIASVINFEMESYNFWVICVVWDNVPVQKFVVCSHVKLQTLDAINAMDCELLLIRLGMNSVFISERK